MAERIPTSMSVQRVISPQVWREKQITNIRQTGKRSYLIGIASPKRSPIQAGSSAWSEERFNASMQLALSEKRRMKGVASSSDDEWFKYAVEIGADALITGVTKREAKIADFIESWHPKLTTHLASIDGLPVGTLEERISKAGDNIRGLAALHGATKGY